MGWLSFIPIIGKIFDFGSNLTNKITELKIQQSNATTERERIEIGEQIRTLEVQRDVLVAEAAQNAKTTQLARFAFVIPAAIVIWDLMVWDKVVCKWLSTETQSSSVCTTDPLDQNMWWIIFAIISFLFAQNISKILKR